MQRDLVIAARDGDIDAYSQLVRAAFPRLYGVANLILRDADRAQDAVQDALVLAWRHVRSLRDPDAWDAWLRRLTVRACYRVAKKDRRRTEVEQHVTLDLGSAVTRDQSAELAERDWVVSQLGSIDLDKRAVLVLHYYLDLPMPEVAEILDIPYGTLRSQGGGAGMSILNSTATIDGNEVTGASGRGIAIGGDSTARLTGNRSCDKGEDLWVTETAEPVIDDSNEICEDEAAE